MKSGDILGLLMIGVGLWWVYSRQPATAVGVMEQSLPSTTQQQPPASNGGGGLVPGGGGTESAGGSTGTRWTLITICRPVRVGAGYITQCTQEWAELPSGYSPILDVGV